MENTARELSQIGSKTKKCLKTQARHDCEKIAITGLEPASHDRSS